MTGNIVQLFVYPVKSLAGIAVDNALITARGLARDREWMIVNRAGCYVTQRQLPQMATIKVLLESAGIRLIHEQAGEINIADPTPDAPAIDVQIWQDNCRALAATSEISEWLAEALGITEPLRLVKFAPDSVRPGKPERFGDATTQFADAAPFLVANSESLHALNATLSAQNIAPVDMRRFRPNIVADGIAPFAEHTMHYLKLADADASFELCDHCQRCAIITVNPDDGTRTAKAVPFKQLASLNPMPNNPKAPAFGVNARLEAGEATRLSVGDVVEWRGDPNP